MTETTWAGRTAEPPRHDDEEQRSRWIPAAGVVAVLGLVGAGGYLLGSIDGNDTADTEAAVETSEVGDQSTDTTVVLSATSVPIDEITTTSEETAEATPSTTAPSSTDEAADAPITTPVPPENVVVEVPDGEVRAAVLSNGRLYLGGSVPNREVADQIIERAGAVVGPENVVDQYVVDSTVAAETGGPLIVQDVVLFAYGSPTYDPQFEPLLDLGLLLLSQNPTAKITIITHTDASGSASFNQQLSYRRGQSVAQYWIDRGIPVEQTAIDARGESDPASDDHGEVGAQLNRRAEFYIEGLLG